MAWLLGLPAPRPCLEIWKPEADRTPTSTPCSAVPTRRHGLIPFEPVAYRCLRTPQTEGLAYSIPRILRATWTYTLEMRDVKTMRICLVAAALITAFFPRDSDARLIDDVRPITCSNPSIVSAADRHMVETLCRLSIDKFAELRRMTYKSVQAHKDELHRQIELTFNSDQKSRTQSLTHLLRTIGRLNLPSDRLRDRFILLATQHFGLASALRRSPVTNMDIQSLRDQASDALTNEPRKIDIVRSLLLAALGSVCKPNGASCIADSVTAQLLIDLAWLEESELNFPAAARFYERAAKTRPLEDLDTRLRDLSRGARLWSDYGELSQNGDAFAESVRLYERIVDLTSGNRRRLDWARAQINYGSVLQIVGERTFDIRKLQQSAEKFRAGLQALGAKNQSTQAIAQINLAKTLQLIGRQGTDVEPHLQAIQVLRDGLQEINRNAMPRQWATMQNNLGTALWNLGKHTNDPQLLVQAARAFGDELKVWSRKHSTQNWAAAQNNLGNALSELGSRTSNREILLTSVEAFQLALEELNRQEQPRHWAVTQHNLSLAFWALGTLEDKPNFLEDAAVAIHLALEEIKQEDTPLDWANMQHSLGLISFRLAKARRDTKKMDEAVVAFRSALEVLKKTDLPLELAMTQGALGRAHLFLGLEGDDASELGKALEAFKEAKKTRIDDTEMAKFEPFFTESIKMIEAMISDLKDQR